MLRRALPVLLIVAASLGCADQAAPTAVDLTETVAEGETQIVLQELPGPTAGTLTYVVRVIARWEGVASYRGEVSFAPGAFELLGTKTPVGADGEMFLVNPQPAAGRLLFSALTTERFSTDEVLRFTVRPLVALRETKLTASLGVVGDVGGTAVDARRVRSADGIRDVKGRLLVR